MQNMTTEIIQYDNRGNLTSNQVTLKNNSLSYEQLNQLIDGLVRSFSLVPSENLRQSNFIDLPHRTLFRTKLEILVPTLGLTMYPRNMEAHSGEITKPGSILVLNEISQPILLIRRKRDASYRHLSPLG